MIIFKNLSFKNFLSVGNAPIEIRLDKSKTTQIIGASGHGKSSMCDAICFALFGKAFRNISKPQLVNSVNGKHCLVTIEFSIGKNYYRVVRGIKPAVFEIWVNGELLNQEAATRDYQKVLEQQILRLNYKVFCQAVILGSASFIPFMQLPAGQRREVIEDILDIRIFSIMNTLLKGKIQQNKDRLIEIDETLEITKVRIESQKKLISTLTDIKSASIESIEGKIQVSLDEIEKYQESISNLEKSINDLRTSRKDDSELKSILKKIQSKRSKIESQINQYQKQIKFLLESDECPTCFQSIDETHREKHKSLIQEETRSSQNNILELDDLIEKITCRLTSIEEIDMKIRKTQDEIRSIQNTITMIQKHVSSMNHELTTIRNDSSNIDTEKDTLRQLAGSIVSSIETRNELIEVKKIHDIAGVLLKDTGIKTAIIREYLPVMNHLINQYLQALDLYIQFELDESFSERIRSRYRDDFSYSSFSEGEKARINIALLFTWREIARMKNSVNTNLLIMDEVLDGSLDENSLENFMNLISTLRDDTNLFIISHRNTNSHCFDDIIHIKKVKNFSIVA